MRTAHSMRCTCYNCCSSHEYKGYKYQPYEDREPDVTKIFHDVITPEGKQISVPMSPYDSPSFLYFKMWVDLDCPYPSNQRISEDDLSEMWLIRQVEESILK